MQRDYNYDMLQDTVEGADGSVSFVFSPNGRDKEVVSAKAATAYIFAELFKLIRERHSSFDGSDVVVSVHFPSFCDL